MNGVIFNGNKIIIEFARPKKEQGYDRDRDRESKPRSQKPTARLYVGRLSSSTTKADLLDEFGVFGNIIDFVLQGEYAFVEFDDVEVNLI